MTHTQTTALLLGFLTFSASTAHADYHGDRPEGTLTAVELSVGLGVMGHVSTGAPVTGYGHDSEPGPVADGTLRLLFGNNRYFRHGLTARGAFFGGRAFGRQGYGYRFGLGDLAYTVRTLLPCISQRDGARFYASASLGLTGGWADAGVGRGPNNADYIARSTAADELDHAVLGWVLGGSAEVHYGKMLFGITLDLRRVWGIDSPVSDTWLRSASLRFGFRFDASDRPAQPELL
ncbi:MAG: hypothetical protein AAF938_04855 [Myxococcota bacterium]